MEIYRPTDETGFDITCIAKIRKYDNEIVLLDYSNNKKIKSVSINQVNENDVVEYLRKYANRHGFLHVINCIPEMIEIEY